MAPICSPARCFPPIERACETIQYETIQVKTFTVLKSGLNQLDLHRYNAGRRTSLRLKRRFICGHDWKLSAANLPQQNSSNCSRDEHACRDPTQLLHNCCSLVLGDIVFACTKYAIASIVLFLCRKAATRSARSAVPGKSYYYFRIVCHICGHYEYV